MGVAVIVMAILSIVAVGYAVIVFQPVVKTMGFDQDYWTDTNLDQSLILLRDQLYNASLAIPVIIGVGVVALWGYLAITRRDYDG